MSEAIVADIRRIAEEEGVDPDLAVRVAKQESGFRQDATSRAGARGIMQLMPDTAKELGVDLNDPMQNIRGGVRYLRQQQRAFGSPELALAAYNAGPNRVREHLRTGRALPQETQNYVSALRGAGISPDIASVDYTDASGNIIVPGGGGRRQLQPGEELLSAEVSGLAPLSEQELAGIPEGARPFLRRQEEVVERAGGIDREVAKLMGEKAQASARGEREIMERAASAQKAAIEEYQSRRKMPQDFVPTQENAGDLSALFGLLGVFGTLIGGGGKQNAVAAMNAMTGMMAGWRQGRTDLYNREKQIFETNMKMLEQRNNEFRRDMQDALSIAQTNITAGMARIKEISANYDMPILRAQADKNSLSGSLEVAKSALQVWSQAEQRRAQVEAADATRRAELARETRRRVAGSGPGALEIMRNQTPENRRAAEDFIGQTDFTAKTRDTIVSVNSALEVAEMTAKFIADHPNAVGVLAAASVAARADPISGLFQRLFGGQSRSALEAYERMTPEQQTAARAEVEATLLREGFSAIDGQPRPANVSQDDFSRAVELQKMLFSLALADAVGTGRPTVYLERTLRSFYAQSLREDTLLALIKERSTEGVKRLPTPLLAPNTRTDFETKYPLLAAPNPGDYLRQMRRGTTPPPGPASAQPSLPQGVPQGSRPIGRTPDGRTVYEAPDRTRYAP